MDLVHNEQTKLTANWFNALATAVVTAGVLAPVATLVYGISNLGASGTFLALLACACFVLGAILHWTGRVVLRRLRA